MTSPVKKGYRIVFLATLIFGIYFETIIFFYIQSNKISELLLKDFKVIVALKNQPDIEKITSQISQIIGIKQVKYIKSEESIKKIENEDKELYLSIKSMPLNPVPDIITLDIDPAFMGNINSIVDKVSTINGVSDIRYKPDEIIAIMHTIFYSKFLFLVIGATVVIISMTFLLAIIQVGASNFFTSLVESFKWFLNGMFGSVVSIIFVYIIIYPTKYISPLWEWPCALWHLIILLSGGIMGWVLHQWKKN